MTNWTKLQVESLIAAIVDKPFLYDTKSINYKHRGLRTTAMEEIAQRVSAVRPNTTAEDCKRKWHSLRTNYLAERRKVAKLKKSGTGADMSMAFIDDHVQARDYIASFDEDEEETHSTPLQEWDVEIPEEKEVAGAVKEEYSPVAGPSPMDIPRPESPFRPSSAPPPLATTGVRSTPGPPERPNRRSSPYEVASFESSAYSMGPSPGRVTSGDAEGAFGKYIACRLRNIRCDRVRAELMFNIEKLFYEQSQK
ncbi:uncharacterized protein [Hetaerina americana]|uniref:uncharacterized protein isoform X2 n=1 Tax=Hetaerina americana TaxID=62018 RepID=UPI003A7F534C